MKKEMRINLIVIGLILSILVLFFVVTYVVQVPEQAVVGEAARQKGGFFQTAQKRQVEEVVKKPVKERAKAYYVPAFEKKEEGKPLIVSRKPEKVFREDVQITRGQSKLEYEEEKITERISPEQEKVEELLFLNNCKNAVLGQCYDTEGVTGFYDQYKRGVVYLRKKATLNDLENPDVFVFNEGGDLFQKGEEAEDFYKCESEPDYCKDSVLVEKYCKLENTQFGPIKSLKSIDFPCECGCENGICIKCVPGCTDKSASNFDAEANKDDGSCVYLGCTDPKATNYNEKATQDDGSCLYPGCTDELAFNYDEGANTDDDSCFFKFETCTDLEADNFQANVPDYLSCESDNVFCNDDGSCLYAAPDLVVSEIYDSVLSSQCVNSFHFEICNVGDTDINEEFELTVTANEVERTYVVKENKFVNLVVGGCVYVSVPGLFNVGSFGISLDQNVEVTVKLDTKNVIKEENEDNNELVGLVYTGDAYYYDADLTCDTFCFETDLGKDYNNHGDTTYKYSGDIKTRVDHCTLWDPNGLEIFEQYCDLPIFLKDNGKFSNPYKQNWYNCLDQLKKCEGGQCVPLDVYCEDAYGDLGPCLQCLDYEGKTYNVNDYKNLNKFIDLGNEETDPFIQGHIDYTSIDNEFQEIFDACDGTEYVVEWYCDSYGGYPTIEFNEISCYKIKTVDGKGHYCENGMCVVTDIDHEKCEGPTKDEVDPFKQEKVIETKLLGEIEIRKDRCINDGDGVEEYFCDGNYMEWTYTSCDDILDESGLGASCVGGECKFFDESLKSCQEFNDLGLDFESWGFIELTTGYGLEDWEDDECLNDDVLKETYCVGNEAKITEHSCQEEGKVCVDGECKLLDPSKMMCEDSDGGIQPDVEGAVSFIDQYGVPGWEDDDCVDEEGGYVDWKGVSNYVREWYCEEMEAKFDIFACGEGLSCYKDRCQLIDLSLKSCGPHPDWENFIVVTEPDGNEYSQQAWCADWVGPEYIKKPLCDKDGIEEVEPIVEECPEGFECKEGYLVEAAVEAAEGGSAESGIVETIWGAKCAEVNYALVTCQETEYGVSGIDQFGDDYYKENYCVDKNGWMVWESSDFIQLYTCEVNNYVEEPVAECADGTKCKISAQGAKCVEANYDQMSCDETEFGIVGIDEFGEEYGFDKECAGQNIKVPACDGKEVKWTKVKCPQGEACDPNTFTCLPSEEIQPEVVEEVAEATK